MFPRHLDRSHPTETSAPASRPADPEAATAMTPVTRGGPAPLVKTKALAHGKHVAVLVTLPIRTASPFELTTSATVSSNGQGPGVFHGRAYTAVTLVVSNGSPAAVDLNQVVVTATYGSPALVASPVYEDPRAQDFSGVAAPGGSASATYVFAIPPSGRGSAGATGGLRLRPRSGGVLRWVCDEHLTPWTSATTWCRRGARSSGRRRPAVGRHSGVRRHGAAGRNTGHGERGRVADVADQRGRVESGPRRQHCLRHRQLHQGASAGGGGRRRR